jgi:uncharacterized protein YndB with AHSA1/START domain
MEAAIDDKTSLQIRRTLKAPVAAVYAAWTDPEEVNQWMAPRDDFGPTQATIDLRVGGGYSITMHGPDGEVHRVSGVYREIEPNRKLVYTWAWQSTPERESLVTVEFHSSGPGTELVLTHTRFFDSEARDKHSHGWNGCLERFSRHVSRD